MPTGLILGIESSCDETSAAVVRGGHGQGCEVLSNVVASQLIHSSYGGVVPELASREHLRAILPVVREAMHRAGAALGAHPGVPLRYADLDAIAVTEGPGLAGALLVGITFSKALAFAADRPLIAVNHLEGHIHAVLMNAGQTFADASPLLALVVSGGHTHLYLATHTPHPPGAGFAWRYRNVGKTLDDAAGEAFDKVAKLLGLPYPGGPWIDALAVYGTADPDLFPFVQIKAKATGHTAPKLNREKLDHEDSTRFDLSFSGIKTAVRRYIEVNAMQAGIAARSEALHAADLAQSRPEDANVEAVLKELDAKTLNLIASFQSGVVKNLARATFKAAEHFGARGVLVSGGVAANRHLRSIMSNYAAHAKLLIAFPTVALSTDNAAMIAAAAWPKLLARDFAPDTLEPAARLRLG